MRIEDKEETYMGEPIPFLGWVTDLQEENEFLRNKIKKQQDEIVRLMHVVIDLEIQIHGSR